METEAQTLAGPSEDVPQNPLGSVDFTPSLYTVE